MANGEGLTPQVDNSPSSEEFFNKLDNDNGTYYTKDNLKLGYVDDENYYDKDLMNYNFKKIEESFTDLVENGDLLKKIIMDYIYPVGSVYMTEDVNFNPKDTFGGKWAKITGRFLVGKNETYTDKGGHSTVTLKKDNLPHHKHSLDLKGLKAEHPHTHNIFDADYSGGAANKFYRMLTSHPGVIINATQSTVKLTADKNSTRRAVVCYTNNNKWPKTSKNTAVDNIDYIHQAAPRQPNNDSGASTKEVTIKGKDKCEVGNVKDRSTEIESINILPPYYPVYMWRRYE